MRTCSCPIRSTRGNRWAIANRNYKDTRQCITKSDDISALHDTACRRRNLIFPSSGGRPTGVAKAAVGQNVPAPRNLFKALWHHLACTEFGCRRVFASHHTSCMYLLEANFDIPCLYRHTFNLLKHCRAEVAHSIAEARRQKRMLGRTASQRERSGMHEHVLNHMLIAFNMQTAATYMDRAIESDQRLWAEQEPSGRPGQ